MPVPMAVVDADFQQKRIICCKSASSFFHAPSAIQGFSNTLNVLHIQSDLI